MEKEGKIVNRKIVNLMPWPLDTESLSTRLDLSKVEIKSLSSPKATEDEICATVAGATVIIADYTANNYITRKVLEAAGGVRHIQFGSVGFEGVDWEAARELGVTVSNTPGDGVDVAEHTLMLILALLKRVIHCHAKTVQGEWVQKEVWGEISPFSRKTLGILGLGTIGREVAIRARAFDPYIIYHNRNRLPREDEEALGVEYCTFSQLLEQSDILTIHVPLSEQTRGMIGGDDLARMRSGSVLINTARGEVVDEAALAKAVKLGKLSGAAIDYEPLDPRSPLIGLNNVILTPHIGSAGSTDESKSRYAQRFIDNIARALSDERPLYIVNDL